MNTQRPDHNPLERQTGLPAIVSVEASLVQYAIPKRYYAGRQLKEVREAVEILVRTAAGLPAGAISPVLFIGDVPFAEYETVTDNLYRFYLFEFEHLSLGAPISLGWPGNPATRVLTSFSFDPKKEPRIA